jgi:HEAT repeat protein
MPKSCIDQLQMLVQKMPREFQAASQQTLQILAAAQVNTIEDLCAIASDTQQSVRLRASACWAIGQFGRKDCLAGLLACLQAPQRELYWEAAKALGESKSRRALDALLKMLEVPQQNDRYAAIIYALNVLGDERAVEALLARLVNPKLDARTRGFAAEALAHMPPNQAIVAALITQLADPAPELRFWAVFALGQQGDPSAIPALQQLAADDSAVLEDYGSIAEEAYQAIAQIEQGLAH